MTRPVEDVEEVVALHRRGVPTPAIARGTGIPRPTVRYRLEDGPGNERRRSRSCDPCQWRDAIPGGPYAYLLGLCLGDGCLSEARRGGYRLPVTLTPSTQGRVPRDRRRVRAGDDGGPAQQGVGWLAEDASRCLELKALARPVPATRGGRSIGG